MDIQKVKDTAYDIYRYAYNNDDRLNDKLIEFYKEGKKNPSVAKIVDYQLARDSHNRYAYQAIEDINSLNRGNPIQIFKDFVANSKLMISRVFEAKTQETVVKHYLNFEDTFIKLYPQTHRIREKLIADNRVCLNKIKPCLPKGFKKALKYAKYF